MFALLLLVSFLPIQASGQTLKVKKNQMKGKKSNEHKKSKKFPPAVEMEDEDSASVSSSVKRGKTESKKRKIEDSISVSPSKQETVSPVKKMKRDESKDLALCRYGLSVLILDFI